MRSSRDPSGLPGPGELPTALTIEADQIPGAGERGDLGGRAARADRVVDGQQRHGVVDRARVIVVGATAGEKGTKERFARGPRDLFAMHVDVSFLAFRHE